jgi:outer membrane protein assembly factor BamB
MAEKPIPMTDPDEIRWNTGPGAEPKVEPTSGKKNTGYALEDTPPYNEHNWLFNKYYDALRHLQGISIREFETLTEAASATDLVANDLFRIRRKDDGGSGYAPRAERFTTQFFAPVTAASGILPDCLVTDGRYIYYADGADVHAIDPETGVNQWSYTAGTGAVSCLCVDGAGNVYAGRSVTTNNLQRISSGAAVR